jgi:hypothetical protein
VKLASFFGACVGDKPVRRKLMKASLEKRWSDISVRDTSEDFIGSLRAQQLDRHNALKQAFVLDTLAAKFALCPRGEGASSFRIFEAMQLGRPPVIIADDWSPPPGPDWKSLCVFVKERNIRHLREILRDVEPDAGALGRHAREAWEQFYSPSRIGITVLSQAVDLLGRTASLRALHSGGARIYVYAGLGIVSCLRKARGRVRRLVGT